MSGLIEGLVIRAYNSYYYVQTAMHSELITCKLRGKFKKGRAKVMKGGKYGIIDSDGIEIVPL